MTLVTQEKVPVTTDATRFQPETILQQAQIQDVALTPHGELLVYSRRIIRDERYVTNLWTVPWAGGEARQLTSANARDVEPTVSPDGRTVAFVSDRDGKPQVWLLPLDGGELRLASEQPTGAKMVWWSPDGSKLLVLGHSGIDRLTVGDPDDPTARVIDDFYWRLDSVGFLNQLTSAWVVDVASGVAERVSDPEWEVLDAKWMSDGSHIVVVADANDDAGMRRRSERAALWKVSFNGKGVPEKLAELPGGVVAAYPSPLDEHVAIIGHEIPRDPSWGDNHLFVLEHGAIRRIGADLDRPVESVTTGDLLVRGSRLAVEWLDAGAIVAQVGDRGRTIPYHFDVATGAATPLLSADIVCNAMALANGHLAILATSGGTPTEIYALENGNLRQLTTNGSDWLQPYAREVERYLIPHPDGHDVETWFLRARGAALPAPLIVQIHGGPHAAHGPVPWLEMLALADAGFHVAFPNPRGSSGYGEDFANAAHGNWGEIGGSDILRLIDWAVDEGLADRSRIGVMGLSHGGYLSTWLLGSHPGVFKAAESENPVSNWVSWYGGSDLQGYTDERFVGIGRLPEDVNAFLAQSPFMQIHRNTAPLLLLQSEGDLRCPPEQSETLFTILKSRGVTTQMVRYPGEPHFLAGIGRPDRRVDRMRRIVEWFERYL